MHAREFYRPVEVLPTRGRWLLNGVKRTVLFCNRVLGRKMGLWRIVNLTSCFFRNWAECPVVGPDGRPLFIDLRGRGFGIVTQGYGVSEVAPLIERLPAQAVVLDIGANIGVWARLFASRVATVYAFEPSPQTFRLLLLNCGANTNVVCVPMALGGVSGTTGFNENADPGLRHVSATGTQVRISTLDDWVRETGLTRLDFMKLDIEGFEEELLSAAVSTLRRFRPAVLFEFLPLMTAVRSKFKGRMIFGTLRALGYTIYRLDKTGALHPDFVIPEDWTNDYLAVHAGSPFHAALLDLISEPSCLYDRASSKDEAEAVR